MEAEGGARSFPGYLVVGEPGTAPHRESCGTGSGGAQSRETSSPPRPPPSPEGRLTGCAWLGAWHRLRIEELFGVGAPLGS